MIMTLNDVLTKQNVITKILLENGEKELSKESKVKVMRIRMAYSKIKKGFDADLQEFTEQLMTEEIKTLSSKERNEEEEARFQELNSKINLEYQEYLIQKGNEEITNKIEDTFSESEYEDIVDINSGNDVEINGNKIKAVDFLEIVYDLFVKQD